MIAEDALEEDASGEDILEEDASEDDILEEDASEEDASEDDTSKVEDNNAEESKASSRAILDVDVDAIAVLGSATMRMSKILKLGRGAVVELDRSVDEPIELFINEILVAKGEVLVEDSKLKIEITEVIRSDTSES